MLKLLTGLSAIGVALASPTLAATATFDSFSEGFSNTTITDDEITFFDLDTRLSPDLPTTFYIEGTTKDYLGEFLSDPNYLTFGGYAEGADVSFGRFGSTRITTGKVESSASLNIFSQLFPSNNTLTLEAFLDGNLVKSDSVALTDFEVIETSFLLHSRLSISGIKFNELRLIASGSDDDGVAFIGIDNVRVGVPEPTSTLSVLAFGALGFASLLKRKSKSA